MTQKCCIKCGQPLTAGGKFCPGCGHPVGNLSERDTRQNSTGSNWLRDGIVIVGILIVVVTGYMFLRETPSQPESAMVTSPVGHEGMGAALGNVPTDYVGLIESGNQYMDAGNFPMAAEMYRRALVIDGHSPDVRTDFGACLHAMGLPERALDEFRMVSEEYPEHTIVRFNMGIVHYGQGRLDSARQYWESFLQVSPDGEPAEKARAYLEEMGS